MHHESTQMLLALQQWWTMWDGKDCYFAKARVKCRALKGRLESSLSLSSRTGSLNPSIVAASWSSKWFIFWTDHHVSITDNDRTMIGPNGWAILAQQKEGIVAARTQDEKVARKESKIPFSLEENSWQAESKPKETTHVGTFLDQLCKKSICEKCVNLQSSRSFFVILVRINKHWTYWIFLSMVCGKQGYRKCEER